MGDFEDKEAVITIKVILESDVEGDFTQEKEGIGKTDSSGEKTKDNESDFLKDDPEFNKLIDELLKEQVDETVQELVEEIVDEEIDDSLRNTLGGGTESVENLTDMVNKLDKQGINELTQFAKSPQGYLEHGLIRALGSAGPHGALIVAIIGIILTSPELFKALVEMLAVKGGPLNQDFRYALDEQENQQFDRQLQYNKFVGDNPVITVLTKGFAVGDPDFVDSSLTTADISRTARIGLRESSLGVIDGI